MIRVYLVNEDNRGCIFAIVKDGKEIGILIYTKEGMKRGGHYHKSRQHTIILKGSFMVKTPNWGEKVYSDGDHIVIDANIPHLFTWFDVEPPKLNWCDSETNYPIMILSTTCAETTHLKFVSELLILDLDLVEILVYIILNN